MYYCIYMIYCTAFDYCIKYVLYYVQYDEDYSLATLLKRNYYFNMFFPMLKVVLRSVELQIVIVIGVLRQMDVQKNI